MAMSSQVDEQHVSILFLLALTGLGSFLLKVFIAPPNSWQRHSVNLRLRTLCGQVLSHQTCSCFYGPFFVQGASPYCSHKVGSLKLSKMLWYAEALKVPFTATKTAPHQSVICHSGEHVSTALEFGGDALYFALHLRLWIAPGDVRLGCSSSAMKTNDMKLCMLCS